MGFQTGFPTENVCFAVHSTIASIKEPHALHTFNSPIICRTYIAYSLGARQGRSQECLMLYPSRPMRQCPPNAGRNELPLWSRVISKRIEEALGCCVREPSILLPYRATARGVLCMQENIHPPRMSAKTRHGCTSSSPAAQVVF